MGLCSREAFLILGIVPCLVALLRITDNGLRASVLLSSAVSLFGFYATKAIIPVLKPYTVRSNLFGYDINKKGMSDDTTCVVPYFPTILQDAGQGQKDAQQPDQRFTCCYKHAVLTWPSSPDICIRIRGWREEDPRVSGPRPWRRLPGLHHPDGAAACLRHLTVAAAR